MPSRRLLSSPPPGPHSTRLLPPLAGGLTAAFSCLLLLIYCYRRITKKRTAPSASDTDSKKPPHQVSYSLLRRATSNFSPALRIGQGGFGSVYRADLKQGQGIGLHVSKDSMLTASNLAVKVMDAGSLQGEREFQNELLFSSKIDCKYVLSVVGFSSNPRKRRMLLIYELMENGSLQDCLFHKKSEELKNWDKRFLIAVSIAKGLEYLHHYCDPPIIHGDIKPSNILLDANFNAKIGDFGLARFKADENNNVVEGDDNKKDGSLGNVLEDSGSVAETESVITTSGFEEVSNVLNHGVVDGSPESVVLRVETSPEAVGGVYLSPETEPVVSPRMMASIASPSEGLEKSQASVVEGSFDRASVGSEERSARKKKKKTKSVSGKDWWWKQDPAVADGESGKVKDYVMEWIGSEIKKERPRSDWMGSSSSVQPVGKVDKKKKKRRQLDWWVSLDDEKDVKKNRRRPAREWWKEEYCEELEKKKKRKKKKQGKGSMSDDCYSESWYSRDDEMYAKHSRTNRSKSRGSKGSMDWWLDGFSGELWKARKNSYDSISGEIPRSGISSTPSMRGTVCYIAPEYGGGGDVSEKCDVYSFGVLLLVLIAGRRPLQVTGSPMSEFQKANLLSWARHLARAGKLLDLVDQSVHSLNKEQALLCITVALLCLQKSPSSRPMMKEVVGMLSGDIASPPLPVEFSPSPPSRFPFKSQKKVR
ncbi:receptor-like serine/threonine-protein kinase At4g25390 [Andrographis paniculata]|uniref:receptor-like serine/threonine-protein kinase At4g25390 n=1 Tax=Andrographis paniculata TaxID=175694 RepID=UPI0021E8DD5D|nr:receptor-like serine/threonine-protein kinase At4g25390 [Andrographis paniculata]